MNEVVADHPAAAVLVLRDEGRVRLNQGFFTAKTTGREKEKRRRKKRSDKGWTEGTATHVVNDAHALQKLDLERSETLQAMQQYCPGSK